MIINNTILFDYNNFNIYMEINFKGEIDYLKVESSIKNTLIKPYIN